VQGQVALEPRVMPATWVSISYHFLPGKGGKNTGGRERDVGGGLTVAQSNPLLKQRGFSAQHTA